MEQPYMYIEKNWSRSGLGQDKSQFCFRGQTIMETDEIFEMCDLLGPIRDEIGKFENHSYYYDEYCIETCEETNRVISEKSWEFMIRQESDKNDWMNVTVQTV